MNPIRQILLVLTVTFLSGGWLAACTGQVSRQATVTASLDVKVELVSGGDQATSPRSAFARPVVFRFTDSKGTPLNGAAVRWRLAALPKGGKALSQADLQDLWTKAQETQAGERRGNVVDPLARDALGGIVEDNVGRLEKLDARTDVDGRVSATIFAPAFYDKKSVVLVSLAALSSGEEAQGLSGAQVRTYRPGESSGLFVTTTNRRKELSTSFFDITIAAVDDTGRLSTQFEQTRKMRIKVPTPKSWAGESSATPDGEFECAFVGGRCTVPQGPFRVVVPGQYDMILEDLAGDFKPTKVPLEIVLPDQPAGVVVTDKPGGPQAGAQTLVEAAVEVGATRTFHAALVDGVGNFIGDLAQATWSIDAPDLAKFLPTEPGAQLVFTPRATGRGKLRVASKLDGRLKPLRVVDVSVPSGPHVAWKIESEHEGTEVAGECFRFTIAAADALGNVNPLVKGTQELSLGFAGTDGLYPVSDSAHFRRRGIPVGDTFTTTVEFEDGRAQPDLVACVYNASASSPRLTVRGGAFEGVLPLTIVRGAPGSLILSYELPPAGALALPNACQDPGQPQSVTVPCLSLSADLATKSVFLAVADRVGNFIGGTSGVFSLTGIQAGVAQLPAGSGNTLTFRPGAKGQGLVRVTSAEGLRGEFSYEIRPGAPARLSVDTERQGAERAGQPFRLNFSAFDAKNNAIDTFNQAINVRARFVGAQNSPPPVSATPVAELEESVVFAAGLGTTSGSLTLVKAQNVPDLEVSAPFGVSTQQPLKSLAPGPAATL